MSKYLEPWCFSNKILWNESQVIDGGEYKPFDFYSRSVLRINVTENVNYTCYALNQMIGGRQSSDQRSFMVYVENSDGETIQN